MRTDTKLGLWALAFFLISLLLTHITITSGPYGFPFLLLSVVFLAIASKKAISNSNPVAYAYLFAIFWVFIVFGLFIVFVEHQH